MNTSRILLLITLIIFSDLAHAVELALTSSVNTGSAECIQGESIELCVELRNESSASVTTRALIASDLVIEVSILGLSGKVKLISKTNLGRQFFAAGDFVIRPPLPISIGAGQSVKETISLSSCFDLSLQGRYTVAVKFDSGTSGVIESTCNFTVITRAVAKERSDKVARSKARMLELDLSGMARQLEKGGVEIPFSEREKNVPHAINVTSGITKFALGSSPIQVSYANISETDAWVLKKPNTCGDILISVSCRQWNDRHMPNALFAKVNRKNVHKFLISARDEQMQIKPGTSHEFALDIYSMPMDWQPGVYELWIYDNGEKLFSNKIKFRLEANTNSIPLLTRMAMLETDSKDPYENHRREIKRDFALKWLSATFDDVMVNPITDRDNQQVYDAKMEQNIYFLNQFLDKWPERSKTRETEALFQVLNSDAKVKPDLESMKKAIEAGRNALKPQPVTPNPLPLTPNPSPPRGEGSTVPAKDNAVKPPAPPDENK
ncbi:MAG TPA: hypothetical protein VKX17_11330 [Planctomycetota bacterium]|nr:hypothetical protein [Planctomycetota bacterium]